MCICVCVLVCVCVKGKTVGWEAYIVKNEELVTADWFSLGWGIYGGGMKKGSRGGKQRKQEMKRARNMTSQHPPNA